MSIRTLDSVAQDVRYALRLLHRAPGFAALSVLMLALGIGATAAIFSIVSGLLLRPLPYPRPDRVFVVSSTVREEPGAPTSPPDFVDWQQQSRTFSHMAAVFSGRSVTLTGAGDPERLIASRVSADFFPVLGVTPAIGRVFSPAEDRPGSAVVVLGYDAWTRRFAGDPDIAGRSIVLDGRPHEVVGVMPPGFMYPAGQDVWLPLGIAAMQPWGRRAHVLDVIARLRDDVAIEAANSEMRAIGLRLERDHPDTNRGWGAAVIPLQEAIVGSSRRAVLVLFAAVVLVLLIACANVASLLLARGAARRRELAIRAALGAGRARLVWQLLIEALALAALASAAGLAIGAAALRVLDAALRDALPRASEVHLNPRAVVFTIALSAATGILFGLAPALQAGRLHLSEALKLAGGSASRPARGVLRAALVIAQFAVSIVLLVCAGLLIASFARLRGVDAGMQIDRVLTLRVSLPPAPEVRDAAGAARRSAEYFDTAIERIRAVPGVDAAAATATLPMAGGDIFLPFTIAGDAPLPTGAELRADEERCTPDYFRVMGIRLVRGRIFDARDTFQAPAVTIVNEAFARRFLAGRDPLGQRVIADGVPRQIVGVVNDVRHRGLEAPPAPQFYVAQSQWPSSGMTFVVRTAGDPRSTANAVRAAVQSVDRSVPIYAVRTLDAVVGGTMAQRRFTAALLSAFASIALVLAAVGIYGLLAWLVAERTREIGIRMALGATRTRVLGQIAGRGLVLAMVGIAVGLATATGAARVIRSLLFEVRPTDPWVFGVATAVLVVAGAIACYVPARRGTRIDPIVALRAE